MLELKNLTKKYGDNTVLDNINFTFDKGVYGLLGANGAGKSTLMNLITDNIKRTSGEILYNGTDILSLGAKFRKKVGYTPQLQGMYEDFTARAFLHYIGSLKGMKHKEIKTQTEEFLDVVGLKKAAHKRLGSFSGGMRQRVLIAAAMLDRPEILILDEPTAGLDPEERIRLRNYIADMGRERTIILATHVVSDIESIAHSVIMLCKGKPAAVGTPSQLIANSVEKQVRGGDIILMHDIHSPTADAVERVVPYLLKQGYQLVTVSELLEARAGGGINGKTYNSLPAK